MTTAPTPIMTEVPLRELTGEQLRVRVARARLYLIDMTPSGPTPSDSQLRDHLAYLYRLESDGRLYGSGPVDVSPGAPAAHLAIVAAASREEAEQIAAKDPLHEAGVRVNKVRGHTMNEGVACYVGRAMSRRAEALGATFVPGIGGVDLTLERLRSRAAGANLFLLPLDPTDKPRPPEDTETMDAHFRWLRENEMAGKLMSCGPVEPSRPLAPGVWGGGLGIVTTPRPEAERIAAAEPSGCAGYRVLSVHSWTLDYGLAAPIGKALERLNAL